MKEVEIVFSDINREIDKNNQNCIMYHVFRRLFTKRNIEIRVGYSIVRIVDKVMFKLDKRGEDIITNWLHGVKPNVGDKFSYEFAGLDYIV